MVWCGSSMGSSIRQSVNIWLFTGLSTCQINFNFADIIHLVHLIPNTGAVSCSSLNMHILTQLLIFAFWSFLGPVFKLRTCKFGTNFIYTSTIGFLYTNIQYEVHNCNDYSGIYIKFYLLTHWGRVTYICVGNLTIIGSDNGLSPGRRQAIT